MERLKVGVIGVGQMGSRHARVYSQLPNTELVAVADPQAERAKAIAKELGVRRVYTDYRELLALPEVQAVSICTPDDVHREPVIHALQAGKHVLLEKPLATTIEDAEVILAAVRQTRVKFMVAHLLRFDPRYALVKEAIDHGELGDIIYIISHRNSPHTEGPRIYKPGTCLTMHVAIHDLDIINWFMPSSAIRVYAEAANKLLATKRMLDAVSAVVAFEDGAFASVNYCWALPDQSTTRLDARMEVVGTRGAAYIGVYHEQGLLMATEAGVKAPDLHHGPILDGQVRGDLREEIMAFVSCVLNDTPSPVPVEEAFRAVQVAQAIRDSLATKAPITLRLQRG